MKLFLLATLVLFSLFVSGSAQTDESITATYVIGELTAVDAAGNQLKLKSTAGEFTVVLTGKTKYLQLAPGETSLTKSEPIAITSVNVGDRVMARGSVKVDQLLVNATHIIVMKKEDIARKRERERDEWRRGVVGRITTINQQNRELTLAVRSGAERNVEVSIPDTVLVRRYAPDSAKPGQARTGVFTELKVGDVVRARGSYSPAGKRFVPEEIIAGTFRMAGGKITSLNAAAGEIVIDNILTRSPLTIIITPDSMVRRILPKHVDMLLGNDKQDVVERLPEMKLSELKIGDVILVSSTVGNNPARATAIILAGGAEAIIAAAKKAQAAGNRSGTNASLGLSSSALDGAIGMP
jgi:co-chaperonin GroES (HSP10)